MIQPNKEKTKAILHLLEEAYPSFKGGLKNYSSAFQMLVAAILSAQSTDKQVNSITKELFTKYPTVQDFANASLEELEVDISQVGLFRNKAKSIKEMSKILLNEYHSQVPTTIGELTKLPGVGRKTANVLLNDWFKIHEGIAVDTHVKRISYRLGFTIHSNPLKIENDLMLIIPKDKWGRITHLLISHGRVICKAQKPKCQNCFLLEYCPRVGVEDT